MSNDQLSDKKVFVLDRNYDANVAHVA